MPCAISEVVNSVQAGEDILNLVTSGKRRLCMHVGLHTARQRNSSSSLQVKPKQRLVTMSEFEL